MTTAANHRHGRHQHGHDAKAFIGAVASACELRGLRLTPLRLRVLELIAEAGKTGQGLRPARPAPRRPRRRGAADRLSRARFSARAPLHPQTRIGQRVRRLPSSERGAPGAVPHLRRLLGSGRDLRRARLASARRTGARARFQGARADARSAWRLRRLPRRFAAIGWASAHRFRRPDTSVGQGPPYGVAKTSAKLRGSNRPLQRSSFPQSVIPAKAGIHGALRRVTQNGFRLSPDDGRKSRIRLYRFSMRRSLFASNKCTRSRLNAIRSVLPVSGTACGGTRITIS